MTILGVALLSFLVQGILWVGETQGEKRAKKELTEQSREVASDEKSRDENGRAEKSN